MQKTSAIKATASGCNPVPSTAIPNDAKLLKLAAAYDADFAKYNAWVHSIETVADLDVDPLMHRAFERQQIMIQKIALLAAHTSAGRQAKARIIQGFHQEILSDDEMDMDRIMAASLARDILG